MKNYLLKVSGLISGIMMLVSSVSLAQTTNPFSIKKKKETAKTSIKQDHQIQDVNGKSLQSVPKANFYKPLPYHSTIDPRQTPNHQMKITRDHGMPIFIKSTSPNSKRSNSNTPESLEKDALDYLEEIKNVIPVKEPKQEFELTSTKTDQLGMTHVKLQQTYQGVPVYASEVIVHFSGSQEVIFNGRYQATPNLATVVPEITPEDAEQKILSDLATKTSIVNLTDKQKEILHYDEPANELVIYQTPGYVQTGRLAWHVTVRPNFMERWEYFVDAQDGSILHAYDHTCSIGKVTGTANDLLGQSRTVHSFETSTNSFLLLDASKSMYTGPQNTSPSVGDGYIITADMNNTDPQSNPTFNEITSNNKNNWSPTAVSAHYNSGLSYDYFENVHGRNSIDGKGGDVVSFINVSDNGQGMDNAFWNGQAMFYGNGKDAFDPLAASLDVGGHEMTHGVIQSTANLEYQGQSGALNESFADVFAVMIDRDDWLLGDDIVRTNFFPSGALRDVSDPHNGGSSLNDNGYQPKNMSEIYTGNQDNGGVHINSGIPNYAFYLFATTNGMTKEKAEKVYYRALDMYLTRSSQFVDCRAAVIQAATDLHGANSAEVSAAQDAFAQVGIGAGSGGGSNGQNYQPQLPVNPGPDFIVSTDLSNSDPNTIYISSTGATNYQPLSQTPHRNKVSVSDDGSIGYFVGVDHHIYRVFMNSANPQETQLSNSPDWDNVAVSKDGNRLAAVSRDIDTAIYVFDLSQSSVPGWKYTLYNPTTAQGGVTTGDVLYADAIEWDYSGEYIMYDAINVIKNNTGTDLQYFDIGFLRAWNTNTNNPGDGVVTKLFSNIPQGVNIGNGVFSKNSAAVIAYDEFDFNTGNSQVRGANIETGDLGTIFNNAILGYPSFSKNDDSVIFDAFNIDQFGDTVDVVAIIGLTNNKINGTGSAFELIPFGRWGVWYATGSRDISIGLTEELKEGKISLFPNPTNGDFQLDFELLQSASVKIEVMDLMGRTLLSKNLGKTPAGLIDEKLSLTSHPAGTYLVRLQINESVKTVKLLKN